jgi:hypothetical protein
MLGFADQIMIQRDAFNFSDIGDSGALIVEQTTKRPIGLLLGVCKYYTIANSIKEVLNKLGVIIIA